jgi:hypothetical protein
MQPKHRDITIANHQAGERAKTLGALTVDCFVASSPNDLTVEDFGAELAAGHIALWADVSLGEHTVHVTGCWEPEFGEIERLSVDGRLLPYGHPLRTRLTGDGLLEGACRAALRDATDDAIEAAGY